MIYLTTYDPTLNLSPENEKINLISTHHISATIPDLEVTYPGLSIYSCSQTLLKQLDAEDVIVYFMTKNQEQGVTFEYHRFIAILQVLISWPSHEEALSWYKERVLTFPKYCFRPDSLVLEGNKIFHVCQKLYCQLSYPPILTSLQMKKTFGFSELTDQPLEISQKKVDKLLEMVGQPVLQALIDAEKV